MVPEKNERAMDDASDELIPEDRNIFVMSDDANNATKTAALARPRVPSTSQMETVSELRCSQVRWFHARAKGGKEHWEPFCGRDSLSIEVAYRLHHGLVIDTTCPEAIVKMCRDEQVSVLGGLYKLNLVDALLEPIYVEDVTYAIRRGTWFYTQNWQPIHDDTLTSVIEREHLKVFRGQRIPTQPVLGTGKKPVLHTVKHNTHKVEWNSVVDIQLATSGIKGKLLSVFSKNATPLARGYKEEAKESDGLKPIGHLVFVIPGVGQKRYPKAIIENTGELRDLVKCMYDKLYDEREKTRPLLLPVEWRTHLTLDGGNIDLITPRYLDAYRDTLNTTALDLMYYMSPLYGQEIFTAVVDRMNDLWARFLQHNPKFVENGGKVSIIGHSLGSVIAYDIVQRHSPDAINQVMEHRKASISEHTPTLTPHEPPAFTVSTMCSAQLNFDVDTLMCLGSPLAVFLQMRQTPQEYIIPKHINRMFNLFHPCDIVAYRIEPLLSPQYAITKPVKLDWSETVLKQKYLPDYDTLPPELQSIKTRQKHDRLMMTREASSSFEPIESRATLAGLGLARTQAELPSVSSSTNVKKGVANEKLDELSSDDEESVQVTAASPVPPPRNKSRGATSPMSSNSDPHPPTFDVGVCEGAQLEDDDSSTVSRDAVTSGAASPQHSGENYPRTFDELRAYYGDDELLPHRYDYMLRQGKTEVSIVKAFSAHFVYWTSAETALWILYALYGAVGEPKPAEKSKSSEKESTSKK